CINSLAYSSLTQDGHFEYHFHHPLLRFLASAYLSKPTTLQKRFLQPRRANDLVPFPDSKPSAQVLWVPGSNQTVLELPYSGNFTVHAIDYATQEIWISDPKSCLPDRILSLNLSGSPFRGLYYQSFSFFNCSSNYMKYGLNPIACLSGSTYTVFATSSTKVINSLQNDNSSCILFTTVAVPVDWPFYEQILSSDLSEDLRLTWDAPDCGKCESRGGRLRYNARGQALPEFNSSVAPQTTVMAGLDAPTIESYPKIVLGESRRLPKPDDNTCSICLSEYKPQETLKTIPECKHCFHAGCIDEWLSLNATCPICRNSPERNCTGSCGNIANISYPFRLKGDPFECGYSPFELGCENNQTTLDVRLFTFYVQEITYLDHSGSSGTIRIVDPSLLDRNKCTIPRGYMFFGKRFSSGESPYYWFLEYGVPINSSSGYVDLSPCRGNGSFPSEINYATYGDLRPTDFPKFCSIEVMTPIQPPDDTVSKNLSIADIYQQLWKGYFAGRTLIGLLCLVALVIRKFRRRHLSMDDTIEVFLQNQDNMMPIRYTYTEIKRMTGGFKDKLGQGGYGSVFKGKLRSGLDVAVKMLGKSKANGQDFISEVATIGRIHHVNVVRLIGFCVEGTKQALVYEFMPNGSLDKIIFAPAEKYSHLCWEKLHQIALGVARGIDYLHQGCDMKILHFDIKPHNILVDENHNPKVSDFGLAKLYPVDDSIVSLTAPRGTLGYMAPELFYKNLGGTSYKADVYSFGMLLLEMSGRRRNINPAAEHSSQLYYPSWIYNQLDQADELLEEDATEHEKKIVKKMIIVAFWCIQMKPMDRPSMKKVLEMLEGEVELLQMPPKPFIQSQETSISIQDHSSNNSTEKCYRFLCIEWIMKIQGGHVLLAGFVAVLVLALHVEARDMNCTRSCGNIANISYPFRLKGDPRECGDRRFELGCENNHTTLYLRPFTFHVLDITYSDYPMYGGIRVVDPSLLDRNKCTIPRGYMLFEKQFLFVGSQYYYWPSGDGVYFLNCQVPPVNSSSRNVDLSPCKANGSFPPEINYALYGYLPALDFPKFCSIQAMAPIDPPFNVSENLSIADIYQRLLDGFGLKWDVERHKILIGILCLVALVIRKFRRRHLSMHDTIEDFLQNQNNMMPIRYSYSEIKRMTGGFSDKLGQGGYGSVFKGKLRSGLDVAVKMLGKSKANGQDFISEVATIGRIHHGTKQALVYEFMPNGSLDKIIFAPAENSSGIDYLHQGCDMKILHFDIKPHNILLDENLSPKVSDFGLAKLYPVDDSIVSLTAPRGTLGYIAPELFYKNLGGTSYKADVYSFGMLLLEMSGRRRNINPAAEHSSQLYYPSWIYNQLDQGDELLEEDATEHEKEIVKKMIIVAFWCIQMKPMDRPSMNKVLEMLEGEVELLQMPPKPFIHSQEMTIPETIQQRRHLLQKMLQIPLY
ncbi:hypothetical protein Tsubulata_020950, partial [Turnera subulata]